mmetsp:Transcript_8868/g.21188  ORF Transcript_8868/g.21188 Transcript_8868/m.21188 type:complete len:442 (+) Transcript_8868:81-1406(+)
MTLESTQPPQRVLSCQAASRTVALEPESEKFALSPTADLEELREFVRCESLERMQLCMRIQKQQELLEQLSECPVPVQNNVKLAGDLITMSEGAWQKQVGAEVDALKASIQQLSQDVKELQESMDSRPVAGSLVLRSGNCQAADEYVEDVAFAASETESFGAGLNFEPALDLQWLEERFEDIQNQSAADLTSVEQRLLEEFGNLKGFVDAAIVAMVSRMSTLEIFVKGEGGLAERVDNNLKQVADEAAGTSQRLQGCQDEVSELTGRLKAVEKRLEQNVVGNLVGYSPAPGYRSPVDLRRSGESNDSVKSSNLVEKSPPTDVVLASPHRVLPHAGSTGTPVAQLRATPARGHSMQVPPGAGWMPASPLQPQLYRTLPAGNSSPQLVASVLATPRRENSASPWRQRPSEVFATSRPAGMATHLITPRPAFGAHLAPAVHVVN